MSKTPHDKAIDKDIEDLGRFMCGVQGGLAAEERIALREIERAEGGTPHDIELLEKSFLHALKNEKEGHEAHGMVKRLVAEIRRLRRGRR